MAQEERFDDERDVYRSLSTTIAIATGPAIGAATAWALDKFGGDDDGTPQAPANDPPPSNPPTAEEKE